MTRRKEVKADEGLVAVKLMIHEEGKKDLEMVLKMRKNSKTGEWKAFDLVGENISILDAKTSEIFPVLSSKVSTVSSAEISTIFSPCRNARAIALTS